MEDDDREGKRVKKLRQAFDKSLEKILQHWDIEKMKQVFPKIGSEKTEVLEGLRKEMLLSYQKEMKVSEGR